MTRAELEELIDGMPLPACIFLDGAVYAANRRLAEVAGHPREALLSSKEPFGDFFAQGDAARVGERHQARVRGEQVSDDYDFVGRRSDGSHYHGRARVAPFPLAGPSAMLWLCTDDSEQEERRRLIRGFVSVAVAAQREGSVDDLFRVVREELAALGLTFTLLAVEPQGLRIVGAATGPYLDLVRGRWPAWIPRAESIVAVPGDQQGLLVDDLPSLVARSFGLPRVTPPPGGARAVVASIPVEGVTRYLLASSGEHLDATVASAFGLFGKQLGAAIDNVQRLEQLRRGNRELRAVNEVAFASATLGSGRAMQSALEQLIDSLDLDSAALFRSQPEGLRLVGEQGFEEGWAQGVAGDPGSPWSEAAATGLPVAFQLDETGHVTARGRRVSTTPPAGVPRLGAQPLPEATEPSSCIAIPLRLSDQTNGVLVAARQHRPLAEDDLRLLGTVAAQVAVALQNATLLEEARRRVDELSLLLTLGQEMMSTHELPGMLQAGARVAARVLRCSCAWIFLPDQGGQVLRAQGSYDPERSMGPGATLPLDGKSLTALAFVTQAPQWTADAPADPRIRNPGALALGCRSSLAVPLISHERSLGVLALVERTERVFGAQDVRLAMHAAQLIAGALESAELFQHERRRGDEMALLQDLSRATAGKLDRAELLDTALLRLPQLLGADAAAIYLPEGGALRLLASRAAPEGLPAEVPGAPPPSSDARIGALEERARAAGLPCALALPLHSGGALLLGRKAPRDFTPDEVRLATGVGAQLSVSLLSARLFEDLRGSYARLASTQAELVHRERLAALGELSASIAHEVRNPLGVIFNSIGSLRRMLHPQGDAALVIGIIEEEADRLNRMVGDLLDYSRPLRPALQAVPLRALVEEALAAARQQAGPSAESVETRVRIAREAETVRADARLLRQALINLFVNSMQAMPRGGTLTVGARRGRLEGAAAAELSIADTGPGVPPEARARLWQPFFTTKATGTGLGLAVVKRIVDGHGGSIALQRAGPEAGAEFRLYLPLEG